MSAGLGRLYSRINTGSAGHYLNFAMIAEIGEDFVKILPNEMGQHPAIVNFTIPADYGLGVRFFPETGDQTAQD